MKMNDYRNLPPIHNYMTPSFIRTHMRSQQFFCIVIPIMVSLEICMDISSVWFPSVLSFLLSFIYGVAKQYYDGPASLSSMCSFDYTFISRRKRLLLRSLIILCSVFSAVSYMTLIVYGGNPIVENGSFMISSHGATLYSITEKEFRILKIFSRYGLVSAFYMFTVCSYFLAKNDYLKISNR